jgi:predicted  nucleic acid-binding Zn-ribbon protein
VHVTRIEVEGGFLDGLDLRLSSGFNVIIGPRGTGKTSIIELLRFALGVPRLAPDGDPFAQARAVLAGGRVTVTIDDRGEVFQLARGSQDSPAVEPAVEQAPLILAQNEIEDVGKDPYGRLNLIDGLRAQTNGARRQQEAVRARIRSLTTAVATASAEASTLADELSRVPQVASALAEAEKEQQQFESSLAAFATQRARLGDIDSALTNVRLRMATLERAVTALRSWSQQLEGAVVQAPSHEPSLDLDADELAEIRPLVEQAQRETRMALSTASRAVAHVELRLTEVRTAQAALDSEYGFDVLRKFREKQPGNKIIVFSGHGSGPVTRQLMDMVWSDDPVGRGEDHEQPMIEFVEKESLDECAERLVAYADELESLERIDVDLGETPFPLSDEEERVLRICARRQSCTRAKTKPLGGGLSTARVLRVDVFRQAPQPVASLVAKLGPLDDIASEAAAFRQQVAPRLDAGSYSAPSRSC